MLKLLGLMLSTQANANPVVGAIFKLATSAALFAAGVFSSQYTNGNVSKGLGKASDTVGITSLLSLKTEDEKDGTHTLKCLEHGFTFKTSALDKEVGALFHYNYENNVMVMSLLDNKDVELDFEKSNDVLAAELLPVIKSAGAMPADKADEDDWLEKEIQGLRVSLGEYSRSCYCAEKGQLLEVTEDSSLLRRFTNAVPNYYGMKKEVYQPLDAAKIIEDRELDLDPEEVCYRGEFKLPRDGFGAGYRDEWTYYDNPSYYIPPRRNRNHYYQR